MSDTEQERREKVSELKLKIEEARLVVDDAELMRQLTVQERHDACNYVMALQRRFYGLTGNFYYGQAIRKQNH